ncbi:MAG TPA: peptidoglycan-binding protein [Solirubrobacteraceae bacterium]|jgi:peptidoglycan hydrolase-like protein with peptidoglycan-binding domain
MSGCPRDLAVVDHWSASLQRSRARRDRATRGQVRPGTYAESPSILALLGDQDRRIADRDLAEEQVWQLSLGRSRARRRAAELQFVPAGSRAKRLSLGALAALTVAPAASIAGGVTSAASASEPTTTTEFSVTLSPGEEGRQVELLQSALGIAVDGIYGPQTERAVESFQSAHGLSVDGIAGPETSSALRGGASSRGVTASVADVSGEGGGDAIKQLQIALQLPADGVFGPETEAAVRRLQARHGLSVDGIVGPATWTVIGVSSQETLTPPSSAMPTAHSSSHHARAAAADASSSSVVSGSAVERLQHALKLPVDGNFGPETEAAVRRLQERHGLSVDGVVGPATWSVLGIGDEETLTPPASARASSGSDEGSSAAEGVVSQVIAAGDEIATRPYVWGGGHGSFISEGYDCSGSVSYALHGGGLLSSPEDSSALESYGDPGPGRFITIYANAEHAFMVVDGKRFDTVALAETGNRWSSSMTSTAGFVARHPAGF